MPVSQVGISESQRFPFRSRNRTESGTAEQRGNGAYRRRLQSASAALPAPTLGRQREPHRPAEQHARRRPDSKRASLRDSAWFSCHFLPDSVKTSNPAELGFIMESLDFLTRHRLTRPGTDDTTPARTMTVLGRPTSAPTLPPLQNHGSKTREHAARRPKCSVNSTRALPALCLSPGEPRVSLRLGSLHIRRIS
uniref:Uncharacterized protein n=1 Tax=Mycena chlorophos TaxID=658473 RepID=A0ABQ0KX09_MYCCL|nr:predicted protein [Mycena chlorophos]